MSMLPMWGAPGGAPSAPAGPLPVPRACARVRMRVRSGTERLGTGCRHAANAAARQGLGHGIMWASVAWDVGRRT